MPTVGIDVGSSFHVAAIIRHSDDADNWKKLATLKFTIDRDGFASLSSMIELAVGDEDIRVGLEPTGRFYSETVARYCEDQGWEVCWIENKTLHDYRSMMRSPSKSDSMDARLIAHYLYHNHLTIHQGDKFSKHLRYIHQELLNLNKQRLQYKNRLRQILKVTFPELEIADNRYVIELMTLCPAAEQIAGLSMDELITIIPQYEKAHTIREMAINSVGYGERFYVNRAIHNATMIRQLDERIKRLTEDIIYLVDEHPDSQILLSVPGIGHKTAGALIGTYGNINCYQSKRAFKRRLGVAANTAESGTSVNSTYINRRSSKYARTALHMAAIGVLGPSGGCHYFREYFAVRRKDDAKGHNRRLFGRLKGKLAEVIYALLKSRAIYQPELHRFIETEEDCEVQEMQGV